MQILSAVLALLMYAMTALADHTPALRSLPPVYVNAATGNDATACGSVSKATPRRSVNGGAACVQPGGTVDIADGLYDELLIGYYSQPTCLSGDAAVQTPICTILPNGPDAEHPTRFIASGESVIISPRGKAPSGGGGIITLYQGSRNLYFEGLRLVTNTANGSAAGLVGGDAQHITFTRGELDNGTMKSSMHSQFFTITHNDIHHAGRGCNQAASTGVMCPHGAYLCGTDHLFAHNKVTYSSYYGVQFSCEQGGLARNRILSNYVAYSYGVGIRAAGTDNVVGSNVLVGNGTGITSTGNTIIAHNTIDGYNTTQSDPFAIWYDPGVGLIVDNLITRQKSSWYAIWDRSNAPIDPNKVHHNMCDQAGNAGCPLVAPAEAIYANVQTGDYHLKLSPESPAIRAGVPVAQVTTDLFGHPFDPATPSLGAVAVVPPEPPQPEPVPPGALTFACVGQVTSVPGNVNLTCTQQVEGRR